MNIEDVHKWEKAVITLLNFDGWELEWCGGGFDHYDAVGRTPKGFECVMEMKFRQKYYAAKMLEVDKYNRLMDMPHDMVKLYFINDPKVNCMFYLNTIKLPDPVEMYCPNTTLWQNKKIKKLCYLLEEDDASILNINI